MRYIYGHPPGGEFATKADALKYLQHQLPFVQHGEYRSSRSHRGVHSIIFSFGGELLAELVICGERDATKEESAYATVYRVTEIRFFRRETRWKETGLPRAQESMEMPDDKYEDLKTRANGFEWIIDHT